MGTYNASSPPCEAFVVSTDDVAIADISIQIGKEIFAGNGSAKRNPIDKPDAELGELLALARAYRDLARQLQRNANSLENELAHEAKKNKPDTKVSGGTLHPARVNSKAATKRSKAPLKSTGTKTKAKSK